MDQAVAVKSSRCDACQGIIIRSIRSTATNNSTPMPDSTVSAANISGKSKLPLAICSKYPMPELEPTNSPTTAPTTASVTDTLRPAKIDGNACGKLMRTNVASRDAFIDRARSSISGSTDLNPTTVETTIGKKPSMNAQITLGMMPKPNQTTNSGAIAILGTLCENTSSG